MKIEYKDLVFFSPTQDDWARKVYELSANIAFPTEVRSMDHLARYIVDYCSALTKKNKATMIGKLRIVSHGSPGHFWVGGDKITEKSVGDYETAWTLVSAFMTAGKSKLEIFACKSGQNKKLMGTISRIFMHVPVVAYKQNQNGNKLGGSGPSITCVNGNCGDG